MIQDVTGKNKKSYIENFSRFSVYFRNVCAPFLKDTSAVTDANWVAMGQAQGVHYGKTGFNGCVRSFAFDKKGNLYAGGYFNTASGKISPRSGPATRR